MMLTQFEEHSLIIIVHHLQEANMTIVLSKGFHWSRNMREEELLKINSGLSEQHSQKQTAEALWKNTRKRFKAAYTLEQLLRSLQFVDLELQENQKHLVCLIKKYPAFGNILINLLFDMTLEVSGNANDQIGSLNLDESSKTIIINKVKKLSQVGYVLFEQYAKCTKKLGSQPNITDTIRALAFDNLGLLAACSTYSVELFNDFVFRIVTSDRQNQNTTYIIGHLLSQHLNPPKLLKNLCGDNNEYRNSMRTTAHVMAQLYLYDYLPWLLIGFKQPLFGAYTSKKTNKILDRVLETQVTLPSSREADTTQYASLKQHLKDWVDKQINTQENPKALALLLEDDDFRQKIKLSTRQVETLINTPHLDKKILLTLTAEGRLWKKIPREKREEGLFALRTRLKTFALPQTFSHEEAFVVFKSHSLWKKVCPHRKWYLFESRKAYRERKQVIAKQHPFFCLKLAQEGRLEITERIQGKDYKIFSLISLFLVVYRKVNQVENPKPFFQELFTLFQLVLKDDPENMIKDSIQQHASPQEWEEFQNYYLSELIREGNGGEGSSRSSEEHKKKGTNKNMQLTKVNKNKIKSQAYHFSSSAKMLHVFTKENDAHNALPEQFQLSRNQLKEALQRMTPPYQPMEELILKYKKELCDSYETLAKVGEASEEEMTVAKLDLYTTEIAACEQIAIFLTEFIRDYDELKKTWKFAKQKLKQMNLTQENIHAQVKETMVPVIDKFKALFKKYHPDKHDNKPTELFSKEFTQTLVDFKEKVQNKMNEKIKDLVDITQLDEINQSFAELRAERKIIEQELAKVERFQARNGQRVNEIEHYLGLDKQRSSNRQPKKHKHDLKQVGATQDTLAQCFFTKENDAQNALSEQFRMNRNQLKEALQTMTPPYEPMKALILKYKNELCDSHETLAKIGEASSEERDKEVITELDLYTAEIATCEQITAFLAEFIRDYDELKNLWKFARQKLKEMNLTQESLTTTAVLSSDDVLNKHEKAPVQENIHAQVKEITISVIDKFKELFKKYHPDKHHNKPTELFSKEFTQTLVDLKEKVQTKMNEKIKDLVGMTQLDEINRSFAELRESRKIIRRQHREIAREHEEIRKEHEEIRKEHEEIRKEHEEIRKEHEEVRKDQAKIGRCIDRIEKYLDQHLSDTHRKKHKHNRNSNEPDRLFYDAKPVVSVQVQDNITQHSDNNSIDFQDEISDDCLSHIKSLFM